MLCSIDVNKPSELEFTMQVTGSTEKKVEPRFIIIGSDFAVVCLCKPDDNTIRVNVPKLEGILVPGKYKVRFEVIVGEQLLVPIEDEIELKSTVSIKASMTSVKEVKPTKVEVTLAEPRPKKKVEESTPKPEPVIQEVEEVIEEELEDLEEVEDHVGVPNYSLDDFLSKATREVLDQEDAPKSTFGLIRKLTK